MKLSSFWRVSSMAMSPNDTGSLSLVTSCDTLTFIDERKWIGCSDFLLTLADKTLASCGSRSNDTDAVATGDGATCRKSIVSHPSSAIGSIAELDHVPFLL